MIHLKLYSSTHKHDCRFQTADILYHPPHDLELLILIKVSHTLSSDIQVVLDQAEVKGVNIFNHGVRSRRLREIMTEKVEIFETSKRLLQLPEVSTVGTSADVPREQSSGVPVIVLSSSHPSSFSLHSHPSSSSSPFLSSSLSISYGLTDLLAMNYQSFPVEKMFNLQEEFNLTHYQYVDILLSRIRSKGWNMSLNDVKQLCDSIKLEELEFHYIALVRDCIIDTSAQVHIPDFSSYDTRRSERLSSYFLDSGQEQLEDLLHKKTVHIELITKGTCHKRRKNYEERVVVQVKLKRTTVNHKVNRSNSVSRTNCAVSVELGKPETWKCSIELKHCWIIEARDNGPLPVFDPLFHALASSELALGRQKRVASRLYSGQSNFYDILDFNKLVQGTDLKGIHIGKLVLCVAHKCCCKTKR